MVEYLPRGGVILPSRLGRIQYGAVPETIKDTLATDSGVPLIFVVPRHFFARDRGILLAEMEFPVYWNFFVREKKTTILCRPEQRSTIEHVLRESCFGPEHADAREFATPGPDSPDLKRELDYFKYEQRLGRRVRLDDMVELVEFDTDGRAHLGDGVEVVHTESELVIVEGGVARARFVGDPPVPPPKSLETTHRPFQPPRLGVSVIGSGHGFDPGNRTSGFLMWIDGRGVLVDPPVDALDWLAGYDLPSRCIDTLILTHCHADHDSGTLQKILQEDRITIYTTPTVLASFVNKYSRLTGVHRSAFRKMFDFVPVRHGEPLTLHGADVTFHYSLHSVPCVGLEVSLGGKSLVYPSDTMNDPESIVRLRDQGVLSQERARQLASFPWHHQLILHEAGVPPVHTPVAALVQLEQAVKDRLYLVHVSERSIPAGSGLRIAPTGLENTIDLHPEPASAVDVMEVLDIMSHIDILAELPASRAAEFVRAVRRQTWPPGTCVMKEGDPGDSCYIIVSGHAAVVKDGIEIKRYSAYDYVGETALVTHRPRSATVIARTGLATLKIHRADFLRLLRGTGTAKKLAHLAWLRDLPSWDLLQSSPVLRDLTANQKTQLQALMEPATMAPGKLLGHESWLLSEGYFDITWEGKSLGDVGPGGFAGDAQAVFERRPHAYRFTSRTEVKGYRLPHDAFRHFLKQNPGVAMRLAGALNDKSQSRIP